MLSLFPSLSLYDYYVPPFSLILVGKHYFSHMHIYTRTVSTSPLYAHICAYVSPARTLSLGLSRPHCPPARHTSLLVVGRYDFIISFGRIPLAVRLDGNTRCQCTKVGTLLLTPLLVHGQSEPRAMAAHSRAKEGSRREAEGTKAINATSKTETTESRWMKQVSPARPLPG